MPSQHKLTQGAVPLADYAFYGLVWAGTTLTEQVGRALNKAHGLPLSWFEVLLWLSHQSEPVSASALGNSAMLSRSQVSRVLDSLQDRGLVARGSSSRDARSVMVSITEEGRRLFEEADATRRALLAPVFTDVLDESDLRALETIWRKLKAGRTAG